MEVIPSKFKEETLNPDDFESPQAFVKECARQKALHSLDQGGAGASLVIGADTIVISPDDEILGKPKNKKDAKRMLQEVVKGRIDGSEQVG